jgi:hypothetical protein
MRGFVIVAMLLSVSMLIASGCGKSSETTRSDNENLIPDAVSIEVVDLSDCKGSPTGIPRVSAPSDQDCVEWWYVGRSVLHLRHVNAAFNCCPVVDADIRVEGTTITVEEIELEGLCSCLCLYDVEYEIHDLPPGVYQLGFIEPYRPAEDPVLECTLDLVSTPSGRFCVTRSQYPWAY